MSSAFFDPAVGGDGTTVTDDGNKATGLADGGHRLRFVPALANIVSIAQFVLQKANDAAAAAASALGGPGAIATSTSTLTIGATDHAIDVGAGKTFATGQKIGVARTSAPSTTAMFGTVLTYVGSILTVRIAAGDFIGTGTFSDWTVSPTLYGPPSSRTVSAAGLATGGGNLGANITITVPAALQGDVWAATSATKAVTPDSLGDAAAVQSIPYAATLNWDTNVKGVNVHTILGGNPDIANPTNLKDGFTYVWFLDQGAAGNRTINSWGSVFEFGALGQPILSTGVNKMDACIFMYLAITGKMHLMGFRRAA